MVRTRNSARGEERDGTDPEEMAAILDSVDLDAALDEFDKKREARKRQRARDTETDGEHR